MKRRVATKLIISSVIGVMAKLGLGGKTFRKIAEETVVPGVGKATSLRVTDLWPRIKDRVKVSLGEFHGNTVVQLDHNGKRFTRLVTFWGVEADTIEQGCDYLVDILNDLGEMYGISHHLVKAISVPLVSGRLACFTYIALERADHISLKTLERQHRYFVNEGDRPPYVGTGEPFDYEGHMQTLIREANEQA